MKCPKCKVEMHATPEDQWLRWLSDAEYDCPDCGCYVVWFEGDAHPLTYSNRDEAAEYSIP